MCNLFSINKEYRVSVDDGKGGRGWKYFETRSDILIWKGQK